ncbi:MAG: hypothetical protein AABX34_04315 [Nanoarchaeota archaeon]
MTTPQITQYIFFRGRVPTPEEIFEGDRAVLNNVSPRSTRNRLSRLLTPNNLAQYGRELAVLYKQIVENGNVSDRSQLEDIINSTKRDASLFWGIDHDFPVQIVPAAGMLEAERQYLERLDKEVGKEGPKPTLPSPNFQDNLEGKMVLSDHYIFLFSKGGSDTRSLYFTGEADAKLYEWDEGILRTVVNSGISNLAIRTLRGETGDNYLKMLGNMQNYALSAVNQIISAALSYSLPDIVKQDGVPVLYRRFLDVFQHSPTQLFYIAMLALGDDIGIENASLFDGFYIQPTPEGTLVLGSLWNTHPNYENKDAALRVAIQKLRYFVQIDTFNEAMFRPPSRE